jgi:hypothetical protein
MPMPYQREAEVVLAVWREAERRLATVERGSVEEEDVIADLSRMRDEYQRLIALAREAHRPEPPPFPEEGPHLHHEGDRTTAR